MNFLFELFWSNVKCNGKSLSFLFVIGLIISDLLQVAIVNKIQFFKTRNSIKENSDFKNYGKNPEIVCTNMPKDLGFIFFFLSLQDNFPICPRVWRWPGEKLWDFPNISRIFYIFTDVIVEILHSSHSFIIIRHRYKI